MTLSSKRPPRVVLLAMHLFRLLIRLGPEEFLQEYEECILSDFRLLCHEAYKQQGIYGLLHECPLMFIKAVVDMREERALSREKKTIEDSSITTVTLLQKQKIRVEFTGRLNVTQAEELLMQFESIVSDKSIAFKECNLPSIKKGG
jgi:hypothetical protein